LTRPHPRLVTTLALALMLLVAARSRSAASGEDAAEMLAT
jgi:hypothetical protein